MEFFKLTEYIEKMIMREDKDRIFKKLLIFVIYHNREFFS